MRKICLALPTNRPCSDTIVALHEEAAYAADNFEVEVHLLVLDSSDDSSRAEHRRAVDGLSQTPNVLVHLLDEDEQRAFLDQVIRASGVAPADAPHLLDLMLPNGVSYGACTNRIFLIAAALGCESVHRRDSDSRYQSTAQGRPVYPVHHEVSWIGRRAGDIAGAVTESILEPESESADRIVTLVGASFVGELSVDIGEIEELDLDVYHEVVSLWAPMSWSDEQKYELVSESFRGAGVVTGPFADDHSTLCLVDPMRIDMCNIAFHRDAFGRLPLLPAVDTIGSDYFLIHAIYDTGLPGVLHNRDIVNYYTAERRTDAGFAAYQLRFAKFFLSMLYLNFIYERMGEAGSSLLDGRGRLNSAAIAALARESALLDRSENHWRLDIIDRCYRKLGGRYADFADVLQERGADLLDRAQADIEDFALLTEAWQPLVRASSESAGSLPLPRTSERSRTS